ncbi:MAG: VOC family protein [Alphaproteobacteria bacterium]|nr:VOC family protein [Alphaproteobacteria bacterium]
MMQQMSLITLGIADVARSRRFYGEGFGWKPVAEMPDITFYQLNGFVFATWLEKSLEEDMQRSGNAQKGAFAMAHNVRSREEVEPIIAQLVKHGGKLLRAADEPPHGGFRGYVADPDDHAWEIAWNPGWPISPEGYVTAKFG